MDELELRLSAKRAVEKMEVLFKEVHHRVKNNLQIVSSLLSIQSRTVPPDLRGYFDESLRRIHSMGLLHERFYQGNHVDSVDVTAYLRELTHSIIDAFGLRDRVDARVEGPLTEINLDTGTALALLAAEVISNACKHAFPGEREGHITVNVGQADEGLTLTISDDGVGLPDGVLVRAGTGMGQRLISNFAQQLGGTAHFSGGEGTTFELTIPTPASLH